MFTGIVEAMGSLVKKERVGTNVEFWFSCPFTQELKVDQSLAHNGVCLTVVEIRADQYRVTAIDETLQKTNLGDLKIGQKVNLERCMAANARFDGHIVQGHVDDTATVIDVRQSGDWRVIRFGIDRTHAALLVDKGSITVDGTSLTLSAVSEAAEAGQWFEVSLIPETLVATTLGQRVVGDRVNIETDIVARHVERMLQFHTKGGLA